MRKLLGESRRLDAGVPDRSDLAGVDSNVRGSFEATVGEDREHRDRTAEMADLNPILHATG